MVSLVHIPSTHDQESEVHQEVLGDTMVMPTSSGNFWLELYVQKDPTMCHGIQSLMAVGCSCRLP